MGKFEHGYAVIIDPSVDRPALELNTTQCVHCGGHFPTPSFATGAAARRNRVGRGFCRNCNGFICGAKCETCVPFERWLDEVEGLMNPTAVSVPVAGGGLPASFYLPPG